MSLKIIIGSIIFLGAIVTILVLTIPKNNNLQTTTPAINKTTTIIPLPTTTPLITTTPLVITRSTVFQSLLSGVSNRGGGGGAAGIFKDFNNILEATTGQSSLFTTGGGGGGGYGAGGGGAGASTYDASISGGNGTQGFVYILEEDKLFTEDIQNYTPLFSKTYTFILIGGGGCAIIWKNE